MTAPLRQGGDIRTGLFRTGIVLGGIAAIVGLLAAAMPQIETFLHWFDWLSAAPGLSGLTLLIASPFAVLAAMFAMNWIYEGFAGSATPSESAEPET